jgi:hypothetical protein
LRIHRLLMLVFWETCFCKRAFNTPGNFGHSQDFLSFPPFSRKQFLRFWRFCRFYPS